MARNFGSLDDIRKKEEEDKKATSSYAGGEKSGLAIQNPEDDDMMRRMQASAAGGPAAGDAHVIDLYKNGFTVDGGPLRTPDDPMNKKFLDDMMRGQVPDELARGRDPAAAGVPFTVNDKRGEDYKEPPKPSYVAFSGEGCSLRAGASSSAAVVTADAGSIEVDPSRPKTRVQIRLADGTRKVQEFNETHTVGDLRAFCVQCTGGRAVKLLGATRQELPVDGDAATLKDAGLCNSAVTVSPLA